MRLQPLLIVAEIAARRGDHRLRHAEPLRHLDREAAPGCAVDQAIGGREILRIERERRHRDALGADAPRLHRIKMRRRDDQRAALAEMLDDRRRQRAALVRIGAGADFVEQDQRRQLQLAIHRHQVGDVRRERAQARLDRLFVADVREHAAEHRQLRHRRRQVQSRLRHQREQARGLERNGLATGVGSGDQQHAVRRIEKHVNRHRALQHRVAGRLEVQAGVDRELRLDAVDLRAVTRLGLRHVELARHLAADRHVRRSRAETIGQLQQDAEDLLALAVLELDDVVVDLDRGSRLEKQRRAGGGGAVHDAGHVAAVFRAHHQHEAAVALGDDLVLQVLRGAAARVMLERAAQLLALLAQLVADPAQLGARLVENLAAGIDRLPDRPDFILERGHLGDELAQDRKIRAGAADARARLVDRVDEVGDHAQLHRLERPADHLERLERVGQRLAGAQREQRVPLEKLHRLAGRRLQRDHDLRIRRRLELRQRRRRQAASTRAPSPRRRCDRIRVCGLRALTSAARKHGTTEPLIRSFQKAFRVSVLPWIVFTGD